MKTPLLFLFLLAAPTRATPTLYLIRHGEKPPHGNGLSAQGLQRAQCLRTVFGSGSGFNIGYIIVQRPGRDGKRQRPYDTVEPLATDLGLEVDISCGRDDPGCVAELVRRYTGNGNVLVCWEHRILSDIVAELRNRNGNVPVYPANRFDLIWTDPSPYDRVTAEMSENCPGLDA